MPSAARPALDFEAFFGRMYHRGVPYVDYLDGLSLDPAAIASILRAVGADPDLTDADVADLGKRIAELGITPAIGQFIPSLLVDMLVRTYPTLYPSVETMEDYEDLAPAGTVRIGATDWNGWSLNGGEVNVLLSEGHSAGGVVFHVPDHRFLMMADETTSIPIWADSDPRNAVATAQRALAMMDAGDLDVLAAGHRPLLPVRGDEARGVLRGVVGGGAGHDPHRLRPRPDDVADEHGRTQPGRGGEAVAGLGRAADRAAARRDAGRGRGRRRGARDRAPGHPGLGRAGGGGRDHRGLRGEHRGVRGRAAGRGPVARPGAGRRRPHGDSRFGGLTPSDHGRGGARDRSRPPPLPCCA